MRSHILPISYFGPLPLYNHVHVPEIWYYLLWGYIVLLNLHSWSRADYEEGQGLRWKKTALQLLLCQKDVWLFKFFQHCFLQLITYNISTSIYSGGK